MARASLTLATPADRALLHKWADKLPQGSRIEAKSPRRSLPQNAKMWACLTEIATHVEWHGLKLSPEDWKLIFLDALKREVRMVPNMDGNGFVNLGRSSSDLTKEEMGYLLELIAMFAANHDVDLRGAE